MKKIPLSQDKFALVDDSDYERLSQYKWYASKHRNNFYAVRDIWENGKKGKTIRMHREVLGLSRNGEELADHKNRNTLDNRKNNLRKANHSLNNRNCNLRKNNSSGYTGVDWVPKCKKWRAHISINKKWVSCGHYLTAIDAAIAYDRASLKYCGEKVYLNFPDKLNEYNKMEPFSDKQKISLSIKNTSGYRGVSWVSRNKRWIVYIVLPSGQKYIGSYKDPIIAAKEYDKIAIINYGNNANLNFPKEKI